MNENGERETNKNLWIDFIITKAFTCVFFFPPKYIRREILSFLSKMHLIRPYKICFTRGDFSPPYFS